MARTIYLVNLGLNDIYIYQALENNEKPDVLSKGMIVISVSPSFFRKEIMIKYKCKLIPDKKYIKDFCLTFECENEQDAELETYVHLKTNIQDYFNIEVERIEND